MDTRTEPIGNVPGTPPAKPLTKRDIERVIHDRVRHIDWEFTEAFEFLRGFPHSVSFFGSARFSPENDHYKKAYGLAKKIAAELQCAIITGGGGGIMEAANRGAAEAGARSVGLNIRLPKEQRLNSFTTDSIEFNYFFVRKTALTFAADAYLFFPGGFGTMDEFFEIATLIQTRKIRRAPLVLVGGDYWNRLNTFIADVIFEEHRGINREDMDLYTITDDDERVLEIVRGASVSRAGSKK